jgi:hypothetical protein
MNLLQLALEAELPVIQVQTDDIPFVGLYIRHCTARKVEPWSPSMGKKYVAGTVYYLVCTKFDQELAKMLADPRKVLRQATDAKITLIFVNPPNIIESVFDAGLVPVSKEMIKGKLIEYGLEPEQVNEIMPAMGGMTMSEILMTIKLAEAADGSLTPETINRTRRMMVKPSAGLELVSTELDYYKPSPVFEKYATEEKKFFLGDYDLRLRPRGILADGPPGTGKTQGAKYIAREWGVPLFRMKATVLNKWLGESEGQFERATELLDREAPCVFLLDEVEKFFANGGDTSGGTMSRMMGSFLWWLQEHKTRVFTIMTCNRMDRIPPELYREGRVDQVVKCPMLFGTEAFEFAEHLILTYKDLDHEKVGDAAGALITKHMEIKKEKTVAHATVVELVRQAVKSVIKGD